MKMSLRRMCRRALVVVCTLVSVQVPVCAQGLTGTITGAAYQAPADSDLVIVLDHASEWRRQTLGEPLWRLASGLLDAGGSRSAWQTLSRHLGMTEEAAFDALLGKRAMFVQRASGPGEVSTWAIVSSVNRATEDVLRERLKPAPRKFEKGLTVMTLEDGRFLLAVVRVGEGSLLLLGPAAAPAMFEEMAPRLGRPARGGLADSPVAVDLRNLDRVFGGERARALALVRIEKDEAGWLGLLATPQGRELVVDIFARTPALAAEATSVVPWSRDVFDDIQEDAYFAVMEWSLEGADQWTALGDLKKNLALVMKPFDRPELLGMRRAMILRPSADALASVVIAIETTDSEALAPVGDRMIAEGLQSLWPAPPQPAAVPELAQRAPVQEEVTLDMQGAFPRAMREVDLSSRLGALLPMIFDRGPSLAWSFSIGGGVADGGGWWTIGLDRRAAERMAERLTKERRRGQRPAPWITLGVVRPALFLEEMERRKLPIPAPAAGLIDALREVEHLDWELFRVNDGSSRGRVLLRVSERPAR